VQDLVSECKSVPGILNVWVIVLLRGGYRLDIEVGERVCFGFAVDLADQASGAPCRVGLIIKKRGPTFEVCVQIKENSVYGVCIRLARNPDTPIPMQLQILPRVILTTRGDTFSWTRQHTFLSFDSRVETGEIRPVCDLRKY
jgi:hypothetical protein